MQMIPSVPYRTNSNAEKKVFDLLRVALPKSDFTAYHSLNLPRHKYKRFGEIDFLLCGSKGLFVLEIKGGRVSCDENREWHFTNHKGEEFKKRESPFRQSESALHGFMTILKQKFSEQIVSQFVIGYGVVLPDCELPASAEWDHHTLADARIHNFEHWLTSFIRYWRKKEPKKDAADASSLKVLKNFIRPKFEAITPLYRLASQAEEEISALTEDQMGLVDIVTANDQVLCSGGAGTGKTFLAMEIARRWTAQGRNVLLVCHSPWLKHYLESRFNIPNLTVSTVEALSVVARRAGIEHFSALIADEGQDLFNWKDLEILDQYIEDGLASGNWCFFYDVNNQTNLFGEIDKDAFNLLEQSNPARVPLYTNCRNTRIILEKVQNSLGADMGVRGAGVGPDVRERLAKTTEESASILQDEIQKIVNHGGLSAGSVTILSSLPFEQSSAALLPGSILRNLAVLDEFSLREFPPQKMSFAEITAFKGLENEAIIVVDLPELQKDFTKLALHYVAMSRARAVLSIIFCR
jgi:hypothetical protein